MKVKEASPLEWSKKTMKRGTGTRSNYCNIPHTNIIKICKAVRKAEAKRTTMKEPRLRQDLSRKREKEIKRYSHANCGVKGTRKVQMRS